MAAHKTGGQSARKKVQVSDPRDIDDNITNKNWQKS